ncbi:MAG: carotenoid oxygenase family protein [Terricaulis sp.]
MNAPARISPYLKGNFAPMREEQSFADLPVQGALPPELRGTYFRNGPNPHFDPRDANYHWFAGDGMIHAFSIANGKARYQNRYVRTPKWELENEAGKALFGTFGNPMTSDPSVIGKETGVANTNIIWHAGKLLALEEAHQPFELDPHTLAPRGYLNYAGEAGRFTAHPKIDPKTGELVFFGYSAGMMPFGKNIVWGVADKNGVVTKLETFEAPYASMIHDFFVTDQYVLIPVLPLTGSMERAMSGKPPFAWEPEKGGYIAVMKRSEGVKSLRWFTTESCYVFHPMNMYETGDTIVVDTMEYAHAPLFPNADGVMTENASAYLTRWTFDLTGQSVKRTQIDDWAGEFPRFDERLAGAAYRHGYFAGNSKRDGKVTFDSIAHFDLQTGARSVYKFEDGDAPGEPVFVPRTEGAAEHDGFLVTTVFRSRENRSDFVVFEAADIGRGPIAAAQLPTRVPFGFHGNWAPV